MVGIEERVREIFRNLEMEVSGIKGMVLASVDGLPIVSDIESTEQQNRISAMVSALTALSRKVSPDVFIGEMENVSIEASDGKIFCYDIEDKVILAVITDKNINLGLLKLRIPEVIERIRSLLIG